MLHLGNYKLNLAVRQRTFYKWEECQGMSQYIWVELELLCENVNILVQGIYNFYSGLSAFIFVYICIYVCMLRSVFPPYIIEVK